MYLSYNGKLDIICRHKVLTIIYKKVHINISTGIDFVGDQTQLGRYSVIRLLWYDPNLTCVTSCTLSLKLDGLE